MYNVSKATHYHDFGPIEQLSLDEFTDTDEIGEGGFANVYSATQIDGVSTYYWKKGNYKNRNRNI